jgi:succinyl-CoA synthetase beta subunit
MKYKIYCNKTKRYIEDDTDFLNREGYNLGEYALRPDGTVYFYESTEGGMDVTKIEDVFVSFS